jgi:hypothetical protein
MILKNYEVFIGKHCETNALGNALLRSGLNLSEPMIFGLGEGLGYYVWTREETRMDIPVLSGKVDSGMITATLAKYLELDIQILETKDVDEAWENIREGLAKDQVVGAKTDIYYLPYFKTNRHFCAHYIAIYGYDQSGVYVIDTVNQGPKQTISFQELANARSSDMGYQPSHNLSFTINCTPKKKICRDVIRNAISSCSRRFLSNDSEKAGRRGLLSTAKAMRHWDSEFMNPSEAILKLANFWEFAGTGGANFRNLYRDFLLECNELLGDHGLSSAVALAGSIADDWSKIIQLLMKAANSQSKNDLLCKSSDKLTLLAERENELMRFLACWAA